MALRTSRVLLTAFAVAAAAAAGQLGIAYGFGLLRLMRAFVDGTEHQWPAQLAWVAWIAMVAVVVGALAGGRLAAVRGPELGTAGRVGVAAVAGLGAAVVAPLTMVPARYADVSPAVDPVLTVGLTAGLGAVVGVVAAAAALIARPLAWNVAAVVGAVWLLALISLAPSLGTARWSAPSPSSPGRDEGAPVVRLGVLDLPSYSPGTTRTLALIGIPLLALLAGAATGLAARLADRYHPAVAAGCGAAGAGMLALAYVLAGPGSAGTQAAPYWAAVIGLAAGALGSLLAAVLPAPGGDEAADAPASESPSSGQAAESTSDVSSGPSSDVSSGPSSGSAGAAPGGRTLSGAAALLWRRTGLSRRPSDETEPVGPPPAPAAPPVDPYWPSSPSPSSSPDDSDEVGAAGSRPSAALTEPTPDPLTAPLDQVRLGRRSLRRPPPSPPTPSPPPASEPSSPPRPPRPPSSPLAESAPEPSASPPPSAPVSPPAPLDRAPAEPFTAARDADRRPEHGDATPAPEPAPPHRSRFGLRRHRASAPPDEAPDTAGRDAAPKAANEPAKEPAKEPAEADAEADAAPVTKRRSRLGLRRREAAAPRPRAEAEPLGADDAEYVDWVSGLGEDSPGRRRER